MYRVDGPAVGFGFPQKAGRKALFGEMNFGSEAEVSKSSAQIWQNRAGMKSTVEWMVPARRALPTLEAPPVSSGRPALEATSVRARSRPLRLPIYGWTTALGSVSLVHDGTTSHRWPSVLALHMGLQLEALCPVPNDV